MVSPYTVTMAILAVAVLVLCTLAIVPPRSVRLSLRSFERRVGTPPAAGLAAGAVGLLLAVTGLAGANAGPGEFGVVDGLFVVFGAFGSLGVAVGLADRVTKSRLSTATECRTGDPETGVVAVDGALQAVDGTFTVPESASGEVLTCAYALQKDRGLVSTKPAWVTIAEGERTAQLAVDDGSGPCEWTRRRSRSDPAGSPTAATLSASLRANRSPTGSSRSSPRGASRARNDRTPTTGSGSGRSRRVTP